MKALLGVVVLVLSALIASSPAHAATWRHTDAVGDVQVVDAYRDGSPASEPRVVPSAKQGDIVRVTVRFTRDLLQVATTIRAFNASQPFWSADVRTSRGERYVAVYGTDDNGPYAALFSGDGEQLIDCPDLRIGRTSEGILARIPRECLRSPYRIRLGLQTTIVTDPADLRVDYRVDRDDALRTGAVDTSRARIGPWIAGD